MTEQLKSSVPLLVTAFLAAGTTGGTSYAFGLYGEALKEELQLTQSQLDTISSAMFCAGLLSWLPGLCVDRMGVKCSMVGGGILGASALLGFWVVAREFVPVPRAFLVAILSTFNVVTFVSCALVTGSVFKIIVSHCSPAHKGHAVGAAKGFVGLGSGAYAVLFEALGRKSDLDFLPMAAFFFLVAASLPALCLLPSLKEAEDVVRVDLSTMRHYNSVYMGLVALAILVVGHSVSSLFEGEDDDVALRNNERPGVNYFMAILVPTIWFGPVLGLLLLPSASSHTLLPTDVLDEDDEAPLTTSEEYTDSEETSSFHDEPDEGEDNDDDPDAAAPEQVPTAAVVTATISTPSSLKDRNLAQMLRTTPAWLMLWTCTILVGGGTVMTNNLGQMVGALRFGPKVVPAALSLFSVAQSFARVVTGSLSGLAQRRTSFLIVTSVAGLVAHSVLAMATTEIPFIGGVFLSGLAFGMNWPLMVLISGELWGVPNVGANYMFYDGLTSALGTLALSKFVAQGIYESHIPEGDGTTCYGPACFQATNYIIAALSVTCIFTSYAMNCTRLVRNVYDKPHES